MSPTKHVLCNLESSMPNSPFLSLCLICVSGVNEGRINGARPTLGRISRFRWELAHGTWYLG